MIIRIALTSDLPLIVDIYNQAIRSRTATGHMDEFTVNQRIEWFEKHDPGKYPIYIAEITDTVAAFGTLSPYRPGRRAMQQVAEVSFFVDYKHHKKGIGTALLKHMMNDCPRLNITSLVAILLDINVPSIALLEKQGFKKWGHLPNIIQLENKTHGHLYYGTTIDNPKLTRERSEQNPSERSE